MDSKIIGKTFFFLVLLGLACYYLIQPLQGSASTNGRMFGTTKITFKPGAMMAPPLPASKVSVVFQKPPKTFSFQKKEEMYPSVFSAEQQKFTEKITHKTTVRRALADFNKPSSLVTNAESVGPIYLVHQRRPKEQPKLAAVFFTGYQMGSDGSSADNSLLLVPDGDRFVLVGLSKTLPRTRPLTRAERAKIVQEIQDKAFVSDDTLVCESCLIVTRTHNQPGITTSGMGTIEPVMEESNQSPGGAAIFRSFWVTDQYFFEPDKDLVYALEPPNWWKK